jgi:ribonuclease HIII
MPHTKTTLKGTLEKQRMRQTLFGLSDVRWEEKREQNCDYRLDGNLKGLSSGWVRVKQFSNGTFYLEASSDSILAHVQSALGLGSSSAVSSPQTTLQAQEQILPTETANLATTAIHPPYTGSDESGKGDYFGPLVVASVLVRPETEAILKKLGVDDSKKLTEGAIHRIAGELASALPKTDMVISALMPAEYNPQYKAFTARGKNLNHLLGWLHAQAINQLVAANGSAFQEAGTTCHVVVDQFATDAVVRSELSSDAKKLPYHQTTQAESAFLGVAAASILARKTFNSRLKALGTQYDFHLPHGAGAQVNQAGREWIKRYGLETLGNVAKLHFKITEAIQLR